MHYLIDGHNLIAKMTAVNLGQPKAEAELVLLLRKWAAGRKNRRITVIFDGGMPGGQNRLLSTSKLKVLFAPKDRSADDLLIARLNRLDNPAEFTVVTDDRSVLAVVKEKNVVTLSSGVFARQLETMDQIAEEDLPIEEPQLSDDDIKDWLELFGGRDDAE